MRKPNALARWALAMLFVVPWNMTPIALPSAEAQARGVAPKFRAKELRWEVYGAVAGNGLITYAPSGTKVDTTLFGTVGTTPTVDTTEVFSLDDWAFTGLSGSPATASGICRVGVWSAGIFNGCDSLFVAFDTAPTPIGPWQTGTIVGGVGGASGDEHLSIQLLFDNDDNTGSTTASKSYGARYARLRIQQDNNGTMQGTRCYISYPSWEP